MMTLEHKFAPQPGPLTVTEGSIVTGYASVFGQVDQGGDRVLPGAFTASLKRMAAAGGRVRMLWQHDPAQPIGIWDSVREDAHGLTVRGRILTDIAQGREAVALIDAGAIDGLSIGYRTLRATANKAGGRDLTEVELWEVSLVTFPMLPDARVGQGTGTRTVPGRTQHSKQKEQTDTDHAEDPLRQLARGLKRARLHIPRF